MRGPFVKQLDAADLPTEASILSAWQGDIAAPVVSIFCATFNHQPYIEDALIGFLIQQTDFPFEIIVHDDASTDATADVIKSYQQRYPSIIKPILQSENQYSQGRKPGPFMTAVAKGRYIALCEGDDFWRDPDKLAKQVKFLESHPDYVVSGHDAIIIDEDDKVVQQGKLAERFKRDFSAESLQCGDAFLLTLSLMYRNVMTEDPPERLIVLNGDNLNLSLLGGFGKSHFHHDIEPAAYRTHGGGVWSLVNQKQRNYQQMVSWLMIHRYHFRHGNKAAAQAFFAKFGERAVTQLAWKPMARELLIRALLVRQLKSALKRLLAKGRR